MCASWGLGASDFELFSKDYYQARTTESMVCCAVVQPRSSCVMPLRLHHIAQSLDGHPIISALAFVSLDDSPTPRLSIMARLSSTAGSHYGFFGRSISISSIGDHCVTLCDARKTWDLCWTPAPCPASTVIDLASVGEHTPTDQLVCIPVHRGLGCMRANAPLSHRTSVYGF